MPTTVAQLFDLASLKSKRVEWGEPVPCNEPGIYIASLSADPMASRAHHRAAPIDVGLVRAWLNYVPSLLLGGHSNPSAKALADHLSEFWLPDENVIYVGQTERALVQRTREFYSHKLGNPRPHRGGSWIKTLRTDTPIHIHFAACSDPVSVEEKMLRVFVDGVSNSSRQASYDATLTLPFANLEITKRERRKHLLRRHSLSKRSIV